MPFNAPNRLTALTLVAVLFSGMTVSCVKVPTPGIYKLDIQQGNVVTEDMLAKLEPNMEKRKVKFLLGTPLITDTFNEDRWDYIYSFQEGGTKRSQKHIIVIFENDRLSRIEGDVDNSAIEATPVPKSETVVSVPDKEATGIFGGIGGWFGTDETRVPRKKPPPSQDGLEEDEGYFASIFGEDLGTTSHESMELETQSTHRDIEMLDSPLESEMKQAPTEVNENAEKATDEAETSDDEDSFFARLKQKFSGEDDGQEAVGQASADTGAGSTSPSNTEPEAGFFERLSEQFGLDPPLEPPSGRD